MTKEDIELLANDVKNKMIINNYLHTKLERMKFYNILAKETMTKSLLNKNIPPITLFNKYNEIVKNDFDKIKGEYENIYLKYDSLKENYIKDDMFMESTISQKKIEEFILDNLIIERNSIINLLRKSINLSKEFHLVREQIRDNLVDIRKGNRESEKILNDFQQNILYESKKCNKFNNKIKKYECKKQKIKNNIRLLEKYIKEIKGYPINFISDKNLLSEIESTKENVVKPGNNINRKSLKKHYKSDKFNLDDTDYKVKSQSTKIIFDTFIKVENLFDISSEEGEEVKIIDDELHSDEDTNFEAKIKNKKKISTNYINQITQIVPKIDFNLINFNKPKLEKEIDIYSFERRNYNCGNIEYKIKHLTRKIKKLKNKKKILQQKESIMKDYVQKLKVKYNDIKSLIYIKTTYDIKTNDFVTQSLQKNLKNKNENAADILNDKTILESIIIEEDEDPSHIFNFDYNNEKSDNDKKETKDTKNYDMEENIKIKKIKNINKSNKKRSMKQFKKQFSMNIKRKKNKIELKELKNYNNLPVSILKKNKTNFKIDRTTRAKSK